MAMAYRLVTYALCSRRARLKRIVSELTHTPTEHAPSQKRTAAIAQKESSSGKTLTVTA